MTLPVAPCIVSAVAFNDFVDQTISPALPTPKFKVCSSCPLYVLVLESYLLHFGSLTACSTEFNLSLVEPSLIGGRFLNVLWGGKLVVQLKLLPEAFVGLA